MALELVLIGRLLLITDRHSVVPLARIFGLLILVRVLPLSPLGGIVVPAVIGRPTVIAVSRRCA